MRYWVMVLPLALFFGACDGDAEETDDADADTDADSDADTDSDTDADSDADTDADTDTDSDADTDVEPNLVVLSFTAEAVTVTGTPFGLDSTAVRTQVATGTFTYDLNVVDDDTSATKGVYDHDGGSGAFELSILEHTVTGSGMPITEVLDGSGSDTWRFKDGPQFGDEVARTMQVDGVDDDAAELWVSLVAPGEFLTSDAQPEAFPTPDFTGFDYPHTFSLDVTGGKILFQFESLAQSAP